MRLWNRTREQMGSEAREVLSREPPQDDAMGVCLNAWDDLSTCRPVGMVEGRIGWDKARDWCRDRGMDHSATRILWTVIKRCDVEELERRAFEARSGTNRPANSPTRR